MSEKESVRYHNEGHVSTHGRVRPFSVNMTAHPIPSREPFNFLVTRHLRMGATKTLLGKSIHLDWSNPYTGSGTLSVVHQVASKGMVPDWFRVMMSGVKSATSLSHELLAFFSYT